MIENEIANHITLGKINRLKIDRFTDFGILVCKMVRMYCFQMFMLRLMFG